MQIKHAMLAIAKASYNWIQYIIIFVIAMAIVVLFSTASRKLAHAKAANQCDKELTAHTIPKGWKWPKISSILKLF
jgi:ABC-type bacteriocin/lantibiotic exporter with double-glycine peptidase domain